MKLFQKRVVHTKYDICVFIDSNTPTVPVYCVYISQLIRYTFSLYSSFLQRPRILSTIKSRVFKEPSNLSFNYFSEDKHRVEKYSVNCVQMTKDGIGN